MEIGKKMVFLAMRDKKIIERLQSNPARYESTKGSTSNERELLLSRASQLTTKYDNEPKEIDRPDGNDEPTGNDKPDGNELNISHEPNRNDEPKRNDNSDKNNKPTRYDEANNDKLNRNDESDGNDVLSGSFSEDKSSGSEYVPSEYESDVEKEALCTIERKKYTSDYKKNNRKMQNLEENYTKDCNKMPTCREKVKAKDLLGTNKAKIMPADKTSTFSDMYLLGKNLSSDSKKICVRISAAQKHNSGRRIRDKRHACYFCQKEVINMAKHLEIVHSKEIEVAKILALPKRSKERKEALQNITRVGDFYFNCNIIGSGEGQLILVRRPTVNEVQMYSYKNYGPCPNCLGFMLKKHLWHHLRFQCKKKTFDKKDDDASKHVIAESNAILSGIFGLQFTQDYKTSIINNLREDEIGSYCKEDTLILKFGSMQYEKYGNTQLDLIRQLMRQLSRLTIELRKCCFGNMRLVDFLSPEYFDKIILSVKQICGSYLNEASRRPEFQIPSLALKIGHSLKKCANIERGDALRSGNLIKNKTLQSFITLMDLEWSLRVSSNALATLHIRKFNVPQLLPLTDDLQKLNTHIESQIIISKNNLTRKPSIFDWNRLATLTLSRIILFNKRRSGEAARIKIEQFLTRPLWSDQSTQELKNSLSEYEKKLAERLTIVHTVGKRGRKLPVLLTEETKDAIELLLRYRNNSTIENNPYIFAKGTTYLRGHDCLKKVVAEIILKKPEYITSTKLRKYVATVSQVFNLTENE